MRARATILVPLLSSLLALASPSLAQAPPNRVPLTVRSVDVLEPDERGVVELRIATSAEPSYSVRVEGSGGADTTKKLAGAKDASRLIVDLPGAALGENDVLVRNGAGVVSGLRVQTFHETAGPGESRPRTMTRLHVSLSSTALFRVQRSADHLSILVAPGSVTREASELRRTEVGTKSSKVTDVRFERTTQKPKKDRVLLAVTGKPGYALKATKTGRLRLELVGADLPKELERVLDVTAYGSKIRSITAFRDPSRSVTIVEIDRDGEDKGEVFFTPAGDQLVWAFDAPDLQPSPIAGVEQVGSGVKPASTPSRTVAREKEGPDEGKVVASILDATDTRQSAEAGFVSTVNAQATGGGRYRGRRIDLDLKDADIHNVLRLLADVGRVNIVTADDVSGNVTIRMRNVPWDQALDVVLQAKGLGMIKQGNLIRVAPLAALQKERELRLAAAKQEYELTPLETRLIPVSYASADDLQARAKDLLSPRGSLAVDERTNVLIARDVTQNLNFIEELVRSLDTQTPQVLVEARIVEATSNYLRDVGIQWGGDASFSEATGNPTGIGFPSRVTMAGGNYDAQTNTAGLSPFQRQIATPNFAVNLPAAVGTGQGGALGLSLGSADGNFNVGVRLSAAEASGMLRVVSSPRILTLDNREARINQGTLIPFSQISAQGVQTTFQEAKLQLLVKPHVTADGSIAMHVRINRDEPDFNQTSARGDPTILKREAETDLLVQDGHTAVIGGIYTRNTGRNLDQVPFFGDIPLLGVLFQRRRASDRRNELIIFLTPRIVNRAEALGR